MNIFFSALKSIRNSLRETRYQYSRKDGFRGFYSDWESAKADGSGYDEQNILDSVAKSVEKVLAGEALFERDSVLFYEPLYSWPLLANLNYILAKLKKEKLTVLDFGGSLGSTYFQHKTMLGATVVDWRIVEQEHFVQWGKQHIQVSGISFYNTIEEANNDGNVDVVLFSGVLQYLSDYMKFIETLHLQKIPYLFLDITLAWDRDYHGIYIQDVPERIYKASYPVRCFSWNILKKEIGKFYQLKAEFYAYLGNPTYLNREPLATYRGALLELINSLK